MGAGHCGDQCGHLAGAGAGHQQRASGQALSDACTSQSGSAKPAPFITLEQSDIAWALQQMNSEIDVSEEDLTEIYMLSLQQAQTRIDRQFPR